MTIEHRFEIHHIAIQTADIEKSSHFYEKILGLTRIKEEESPKGRKIIWLDSGSGRIELYSGKRDQRLEKAWNPNAVGPLALGFFVPDLDDAVRRLAAVDVSILKQPYEPVPGERAAMIEGPEGEEIVLLENTVKEKRGD